jgi:hypothetical protein
MISLRELIDFYYYGRHRLEAIPLLPLGSKVSDASALYGEPFESEPSDETPEITVHSFRVGSYHEGTSVRMGTLTCGAAPYRPLAWRMSNSCRPKHG